MEQITTFTDERHKAWCIHCTRWLGDVKANREHVPSRSLLYKPYPENLPVVEICTDCNTGFSKDEEYVLAFLSAVLSGSTEPEKQANPKAAAILRRNKKLQARIARAKSDYETRGGETRLVWKPEAQRVARVLVKNARGHLFFEYGEPVMENPERVWFMPLESLTQAERASFEFIDTEDGWPEVGSRMMTRALTGQDIVASWIVVQPGIYRYAAARPGGFMVRMVLQEYLAAEICWDG